MSSTLDQLQQKVDQAVAAYDTYSAAMKAATDKINAVDPKDPTAIAQIDAAIAEQSKAFDAYIAIIGPLGKEIPALYNQLPANEQDQGLALLRKFVDSTKASTAETAAFHTNADTKKAEATAAAAAVNKEVADNAAKPSDPNQQSNKYVANGGAQDDKGNPTAPGQNNNTLNKTPPAGGGAPVVTTPTTTSGTSGTDAAKPAKNGPGKRIQNPLGNFSSYTYQISLYMITPDAYDAFIQSGRKDINAINNMAPGASTPESVAAQDANTRTAAVNSGFVQAVGERGRTTSPPAASSANASATQYTNGVYLVAQSGGINNKTEKRAPGFELDYYIDDLKITQAISGKDTNSATNVTDISFVITEPYGFSFVTKLRNAANELAKVSKSKNFKDIQNPSRQFFMLGIRFLGYDKDGYLIDPTKIPSADGDPQGNAFGLYERFFDIFIKEMKFKIDGRAVIYNIKAASVATGTAFGTKRGFIDNGAVVLGSTVYDALMGDHQSSFAGGGRGTQGQGIGLLAKLNKDQQTLLKNKSIEIANEWDVVFLGDAENEIKTANIVNKDVLDKRIWAMSSAKNTSESNVASEEGSVPSDTVRQITFTKGGSILQCVNQIILQSDYLLNALTTAYQSTTEPEQGGLYAQDTEPNPIRIKWYTMHAEVKNLGWDKSQKDFAYKTTFTIQPYETPVVVAPYAKPGAKYYGPHKRYEYWFTGKNSEILAYEQQMDNSFFNVAVSGTGDASSASGTGADIPVISGKEQGQAKTGALDVGLQAQNSYMTSLYDPGAYAKAKIKILGDPDFLMQSAPSSINSFYDQYYGTDGYTINPNGGQVFIEINFKEPQDYQNSTGLLSVNQSIYFWQYPASVQKDLDSRGGGVSYMVTSVVSSFRSGKFEQDLECNINTFPADSTDTNTTAAARENQSDAESARLNRSGTGSAPPTANGSATTASVNSTNNIQDPAARAAALQASLPGSVNSLNTVVDPMQRAIQNQTLTIPTLNGPVQHDDAGVTMPTVFGRG